MTATVLVIEHETNAGLDLMSAGLGDGVRVIRPYLGDRLPEPADLAGRAGYRGLIVLGGSMGALDDEVAPWLPGTRRLLVDAVRRALPTLGICLGAQLLAVACGGTVQRGERGVELGLVPVTSLAPANSTGTDPFFGRLGGLGPFGSDWLVNQYHFDAVTRLPPDAELAVTGKHYPNQGFRVGPAAWGVQYHPEVSTERFVGWVDSGLRSGELGAASARVIDPVRAGQAAQRRVAAAHAAAFAELVRNAAAAGG